MSATLPPLPEPSGHMWPDGKINAIVPMFTEAQLRTAQQGAIEAYIASRVPMKLAQALPSLDKWTTLVNKKKLTPKRAMAELIRFVEAHHGIGSAK